MKGFTKLDNNLLFSNKLEVYGKLVLMGLTYFTRNGTGKCFCKKTTLASYLNLSLYQVRCGLVELEEMGVIHIQRVGQGNPDIITLNDLKSRNEKDLDSIHIIEENKKEEEDISKSIDSNEVKTPPPPPPARVETTDTSKRPSFDVVASDPPGNHHQHTQSLLTSLRDVLRPHTYHTWFGDARVVSVDNDKMTIGFPLSSLQCSWIHDNYVDLLSKVSRHSITVVKLKGGSDG